MCKDSDRQQLTSDFVCIVYRGFTWVVRGQSRVETHYIILQRAFQVKQCKRHWIKEWNTVGKLTLIVCKHHISLTSFELISLGLRLDKLNKKKKGEYSEHWRNDQKTRKKGWKIKGFECCSAFNFYSYKHTDLQLTLSTSLHESCRFLHRQ